ncbi:hypothetical protein [Sedimentitalea todarodis]|uniref:Surface antigen domain-containing protein n=1 Tax=Sedimentitalea todarodis TaxID=1631240 RepID=A0ABU3VGF5_9RHOB|nr:hypothetical protein [Sedimentitalea todarodis]MDU9005065.1 hypothetical protein [Sedimentitalea todarodis]
MRKIVKLIVAISIAMAAPVGGMAKPLSMILADSGLSPQDFDLLSATEKQLYTPTVKPTGTELSWSNPETGARGEVKLAAVRGDCVFVEHFVYPKGATEPIELKPQMCKAADGRWLLAP